MFIKIYSGVVGNTNKTLKKTVEISELISKLNDNYLISRLREFSGYGEINLWDLGKKAKSEICSGDYLCISCKDNIYFGQIIGVIEDKNGEIGDVVGWRRQFENPWSNVIMLKNVRVVPKEEKIPIFIKEHSVYPYEIFKNFIKLEGKEEDSFFNLIKADSQAYPIKLPEKTQLVLPHWLKNIINDIKKLKASLTHHERSNESLIERFFENLGYERFNDIIFRKGRIDISISIDNLPVIVVEVKRYWNLNVHSDCGVVRQAYNYALENGAKIVIITNGDYYAIYDRERGRTYNENLVGEFILTNLQISDLRLINSLRKDSLM